MIKVEKSNKYNTFYWPAKSDVFDTNREENLKVKLFGITIFTRKRTMEGEYFENEKKLSGFRKISSDNN